MFVNDGYENMIVTDNETDDLLAKMHYELLIEEVQEQIDIPFMKSSTNFIEFYNDQYEFIKNQFAGNEDFLAELKSKRNETMDVVLEKIEKRFKFTIDRTDIKLNKVTKAVYEFFVLNYVDNLTSLVVNFIMKNKKTVINELKALKNKSRDVSYIASKMMFSQNDGLILNNVSTIIFSIMPGFYEDVEFLKLITEADNDYCNKIISKTFIEKDCVDYDTNLYDVFLKPLLKKNDGYSDVICNVTTILYSKIDKNSTMEII